MAHTVFADDAPVPAATSAFVTPFAGRFQPAEGEATLSGLYIETDDRTGKVSLVRMIREGGRLEAAAP